MNERILQFIESTGLSAIQFADKVGLNRSIIYHIKNGRSAPSLDVVLKILNVFPQISTDWLLHGKGEMFNGEAELFSANNLLFIDHEDSDDFIEVKQEDEEIVSDNQSDVEPPISLLNHMEQHEGRSSNRVPVKMIIFYSDDSFEVFSLGKSTLV